MVAQELGIGIDPFLFNLVKRSAKARNGIHLYKLINDGMELGYTEATRILSVAHEVLGIVKGWLDQGEST